MLCIAGKFNQVFLNLLSNAADSGSEKDGAISISLRSLKKSITIEISDNGEGIDEDNIQKIFDPFFTTKQVGKGTGLGLYIVFGIIEQHKGKINANSKLSQGTTFKIELPV